MVVFCGPMLLQHLDELNPVQSLTTCTSSQPSAANIPEAHAVLANAALLRCQGAVHSLLARSEHEHSLPGCRKKQALVELLNQMQAKGAHYTTILALSQYLASAADCCRPSQPAGKPVFHPPQILYN